MLSLERRASAAATQKQCEANQNIGGKQFSSPFFHTNTSQRALTCLTKPFVMFLRALPRSLKITPSYDLSLALFYVLQQFKKEYRDYSTNCTKHYTPEKFFIWKHFCLFVKGQMFHNIGKILAEMEWSSLSQQNVWCDRLCYVPLNRCLTACLCLAPIRAAFVPLC